MDLVYAAQETTQGKESTPGPAPGPTSLFGNPLIMILLFGVIMYAFLFRPQQKREKERREMLASVAKGDRVVTTGGICGTVVGLSEKTVVLRVGDENSIKIEFLRGAISQITSREADK